MRSFDEDDRQLASCRRRRIDYGAIPVFHQFAVLDAEGIEGEGFVKLAGFGGRVLAEILVDDSDDVAFRGYNFEGVTRRGRWTGGGTATAATAAGECGLEFLIVTDLVLFGAFLERRIVLFIGGIRQSETVCSRAEELERDFLVGF